MVTGPRVTIVVITHNRCAELLRTLRLLAALPERPPVVVVDNGSADGTAVAVREQFPAVTLIEPGRNLGAVGRNIAVACIDSPYVAFCDDDTWWEAGSLGRAADLLDAHPEVAVLTARIVVEPGARVDPINEELLQSPVPTPAGAPGPALGSFLAGASVVRRRAFEAVGGFDPWLFLGGEEEMLASRLLVAGWLICHVPDLVIHHLPSPARDPHERRRLGVRNALCFWWSRRPVRSALRRSLALLRTAPHDRVTALGVYDALRGLPHVVRTREVVPPHVESMYRLLDEAQMASKARRYVS